MLCRSAVPFPERRRCASGMVSFYRHRTELNEALAVIGAPVAQYGNALRVRFFAWPWLSGAPQSVKTQLE